MSEQIVEAVEGILNAASDRASMQDVAAEISQELGGPKGIAALIKTMLFDETAPVATKQRLLGIALNYLKDVSKIQGDRDQVEMLPVEELERELLQLVGKHGQVPIQGGGRWVFLHDDKSQGNRQQEGHEAPALTSGMASP